MKLILACPSCGHTGWCKNTLPGGEFVCMHCGDASFPEHMVAVPEKEGKGKEKKDEV